MLRPLTNVQVEQYGSFCRTAAPWAPQGDNGKENGNYYSILGFYRENGKENGKEHGKEHGNYCSILGLDRDSNGPSTG